MRILRSVNRRGFDVGTAGKFTVLKPNTWFAASRFPDRFPNLRKRIEAAAREKASSAAANESTLHLELKAQPEPLNLMRLTLILLVASGITMFLYWWVFMRPNPAYRSGPPPRMCQCAASGSLPKFPQARCALPGGKRREQPRVERSATRGYCPLAPAGARFVHPDDREYGRAGVQDGKRQKSGFAEG